LGLLTFSIVFSSSPSLFAVWRARQAADRDYEGTWGTLSFNGVAAPILATSLVTIAATAGLLVPYVGGWKVRIVFTAILMAAIGLAGGWWTASRYRGIREGDKRLAPERIALVGLAASGLSGSVAPLLAMHIQLCRHPDGFGVALGLGLLAAFLAVEITYGVSGFLARRMRKRIRDASPEF
jgi:hypothetical protein